MKKYIFFLISFVFAGSAFASVDCSGEICVKYSHRNQWSPFYFQSSLNTQYNNDNLWFDSALVLKLSSTTSFDLPALFYLDKIMVGYDTPYNFIVSVGRDKSSNLFSSKMQNHTYFNGIFAQSEFNNFKLKLGEKIFYEKFFEQDMKYVSMGEISYKFEACTVSYALTYWPTQFDFLISEFSVNRNFKIINLPCNVYVSFLQNHKNHADESSGLCVAFQAGKIKQKGDASLEVQVQEIGWDAIPYFDQQMPGCGTHVQYKMAYALADNFLLNGKVMLSDHYTRSEIGVSCKW